MIMLANGEIDEINAWANVLQALGKEGHDKAHVNQEVLREITALVKKRLESIPKSS